MKKRLLILLIILVVIIAGFFYLWFIWIPLQIEKDQGPTTQPPTLFAKDDYKIEEKQDGKYIVVKKVGLTAKVPEGWKAEIEGSDYPESGYWLNISSFNAELKYGILSKGCGISIMTGETEKNIQEIKENIKTIEINPDMSKEIKKDYDFEIFRINDLKGLKWTTTEKPILGQVIGIEIPINDKRLISINTRLLTDYKEQCLLIWEEFIKNITIK